MTLRHAAARQPARRIDASDEDGMALLLALSVMVVVSLVAGAVMSYVLTSLSARASLDTTRNRQYAAEAGVDFAVTQVRALGSPYAGLANCSPTVDGTGQRYYVATPQVNMVPIRVDCTNQLGSALVGGQLYQQRNVIFAACVDTGVACGTNAIVRAQVNFEFPAGGTAVTRTWVQSWSVNR